LTIALGVLAPLLVAGHRVVLAVLLRATRWEADLRKRLE
jgi:hypothetical protein